MSARPSPIQIVALVALNLVFSLGLVTLGAAAGVVYHVLFHPKSGARATQVRYVSVPGSSTGAARGGPEQPTSEPAHGRAVSTIE
jgi:hypothetical protein